LSSLDTLLKLPRRHAVTFRDVTVPGETYRAPLPASGTQLSFALPLGPTPSPDWQAEATIEIASLRAEDTPPIVSINGAAAKFQSNKATKGVGSLLTYSFPANALAGNNRDTIAVTAGGKDPIKVQRVEVSLRPRG
jgi:hypothetical protein